MTAHGKPRAEAPLKAQSGWFHDQGHAEGIRGLGIHKLAQLGAQQIYICATGIEYFQCGVVFKQRKQQMLNRHELVTLFFLWHS